MIGAYKFDFKDFDKYELWYEDTCFSLYFNVYFNVKWIIWLQIYQKVKQK